MTKIEPVSERHKFVQILRHAEVQKRIKVSSAKLFDMVAKKQFPKPFLLVPGGRAVGWLEADVVWHSPNFLDTFHSAV